MFTGIVAAVGQIRSVVPGKVGDDDGVRVTVDVGELDLSDVVLGDSIALAGACMTVVAVAGSLFEVDISHESLARTVGLATPGPVNIEKSLRLGDALGGHLVSGHVDGIGEVIGFNPVGESFELRVRAPLAMGRFFAYKGSVTVNGVSLTINAVEDGEAGTVFGINLIPHTLAVTTLGAVRVGTMVNIEVDMIARYIERIVSGPAPVRAAPVSAP